MWVAHWRQSSFMSPVPFCGDKEVRELPVKVWRHIKENQG